MTGPHLRNEVPGIDLQGEFYTRLSRAISSMMGVNPADINAPTLRLNTAAGVDIQLMQLDAPPFRVNGVRFRATPLEQVMSGVGAQTANFQIQTPQLDRAAAFCAVLDTLEFTGPNPIRIHSGFGVDPANPAFGGHVVANWTADGQVIDMEKQVPPNDRQNLGLSPSGRRTPMIWETGFTPGVVGAPDGDFLNQVGPIVGGTPLVVDLSNVALWARMAVIVRSVNNAAAGTMRVLFTGTLWTLALTPVP